MVREWLQLSQFCALFHCSRWLLFPSKGPATAEQHQQRLGGDYFYVSPLYNTVTPRRFREFQQMQFFFCSWKKVGILLKSLFFLRRVWKEKKRGFPGPHSLLLAHLSKHYQGEVVSQSRCGTCRIIRCPWSTTIHSKKGIGSPINNVETSTIH